MFLQQNSSCAKTGSQARKSRTFFSLQMDIHLMRLCVEHNPYQLGKNQWDLILADMKETFNVEFLLRTLKERANKLVDKYQQEQLQYKTGTEKEHTELGNLLEVVVAYIDASNVPITRTTNADSRSADEDETDNSNVVSTPQLKTARPRATAANVEKHTADMERDELLNQTEDTAPGPITVRKKRSALLPEDELIKRKQEQDYDIEVKKLKLEERKMEIEYDLQQQKATLEREKLEVEKEKIRITEEENKRRDVQQQQMHELLMLLAKK
ncbi:uncharacterized protein LOC116178079 isoform X2 [Photinus pyralis]|uniref:uncharacterized protein LOC116175133 isoform X2 n=1 Tax=Photinus pyralis TaxID=7054 RepID=UPI001266F94E|nr:uncharacterized protein LOC116175133 isoform X2 [Photinus pyralis]XP_031349358.1 uncharacterized protein LOC116175396 isoform X2 [Photinus pyralis]XP_031353244.1 uncharacterized protein LOC116178079 isoform X2 [Photinus pyralis]